VRASEGAPERQRESKHEQEDGKLRRAGRGKGKQEKVATHKQTDEIKELSNK
jgi:hypothetical protein